MGDGIYSAVSGAVAQQRSLDVVANNVANARTTAYRGDRVAFAEALANTGENRPEGNALRYVSADRIRTSDEAGTMRQTGNPLDVALAGDGFLAVETPAGERYVRAGSLVQSADGFLVTQSGHRVLGLGPSTVDGDGGPPSPLRLPPDTRDVQIARDGLVTADGLDVGALRVVRFEDPAAVRKEGLNLFAGDAPPVTDTTTEVMQGYLESSNVNAVAGVHELVTVTRSFEALQKVIDTFQRLDDRAARDVGRRG